VGGGVRGVCGTSPVSGPPMTQLAPAPCEWKWSDR